MTKKERFLRVAAALEQLYPDARCSLFSGNAFELLVAVRLSAQCTDARVNQGGEYYRNGTQSTRRLRWSGAGHH